MNYLYRATILLLFLLTTSCEQDAQVDPIPVFTQAADLSSFKPRCHHYESNGIALFGDLHVHTALSLDAYQQDVRTTPTDAYAFARGERIAFHDSSIQIDRPLDFAAVTDHAEYLADLQKCKASQRDETLLTHCESVTKGSGAGFQILKDTFEASKHGSRVERVTHALKILFESEDPVPNHELCGAQGELCEEAKAHAWQIIKDAAESAYDRSPECRFTSFIGYEYSGVKSGSNYHRNVIFKNEHVPVEPVSYLHAPRDRDLWKQLERHCLNDIEQCDFLAIPHNPNLSNGILLTPDYSGLNSNEQEKNLAALRYRSEPLLEIFQHKGQSECINGLQSITSDFDPLCEFEQVRKIASTTIILDTKLLNQECTDSTGYGGMINTGCISKNDFLRGALLTGLEEQQRLGVNPLQLGVIASTDTHESTPGAVDEQSWRGHVGRESSLKQRLQKKVGLPYRLDGNAGGLAGVWAEENSREAIFAALKRRETFGTSGPRIQPRFFGAWSFEENICQRKDFIEQAYQLGTAMGGELSRPGRSGIKPKFILAALKDPEGNSLQGLQLVKGWIDNDGVSHNKIINVGGNLDSANLNGSKLAAKGFDSLCHLYSDENFKPEEPAYYYLRVVEIPSKRWSYAQCLALEENARPVECDNNARRYIQERAWTSPIWYRPSAPGTL
ncbi:MAG: DUF3604 domain-containing protein [Gammaproteobacteria bacterium]|nr:DUF3604 domain-containing protein [Gammaproteobacteria bacterium]